MGKGGAGKGGRQQISGPRQVGTVIEWKGAFGWIKPLKAISHPKSKGGKVYLAAEDVAEELEGVGAKVSFTLYSDSNGLGAGSVKMASVAVEAAARNAKVTTGGKVAPTFSTGKGNATATPAKGKGKVNKGAMFNKGSNVAATTSVKVSKFGHKVVSSTATKVGKFASKAVAAKVPATWSKGGGAKGGSLQKTSSVQQAAWQKPSQGHSQKGGVTKGKGKGGKGVASNDAKGTGKQAKREMIHDKPLIGTVTQWRGKFGWIKPKDTIDHPLAKKHQGDLFLGQQDVETEISGEGARVRFMLYQDSHGLGAANVRAA